ncbi:hypothetical protein [Streptomyces sp. SBT349]|uniref:hypothetical protein n=1 Tax=Streptomyces sp. SBT349 TaxID=1580539 RepID=UPI00066B9A52|nr:hypothetical protein [Streptomyces sp. SBT349]
MRRARTGPPRRAHGPRVLAPLTTALLTTALLTTGLLALGGAALAAAEGPVTCTAPGPTGDVVIIDCEDPGENDPGDEGDDGSGDGTPACDLSQVEGLGKPDASRWCEGQNACWANIPSSVYPDPADWPEGRPTPESVYIYKECRSPAGEVVVSEWTWHEPEGPSLEELARQAYGLLAPPDFGLAFSPPEQSVIFVETWWWAAGAGGEIVGSSALGVRAVGTPSHIEVDPGDGSGAVTCPFVTSEADTCAHTYERAESDPGYAARARLVYDVHYEQNGNALDFPALPDALESAWAGTTVPVVESQAVVVR